jgi:hypothetical protein
MLIENAYMPNCAQNIAHNGSRVPVMWNRNNFLPKNGYSLRGLEPKIFRSTLENIFVLIMGFYLIHL